jgi:hypothetical protein
MNIIQQQELARNSSEQQLISLAEQPNPSIMPPYLVTGELMRRKSIREKMAQAPKQTVSEEVLEEAVQSNMPQGIGALTEDMATPMAAPQEEIMSESETISETGIANLPAPNIGQNYAGGGIVYNDGTQGYPVGGLVVPAIGAGLRYLGGTAIGQGVKRGLGSLFRKAKPPVKSPTLQGPKGPNSFVLPQAGPGRPQINTGYLRQPGAYVDTTIIGGIIYAMTPDGPKEITQEEKKVIDTNNAGVTQVEDVTEIKTEEVDSPIEKARKRMMMYKEFMGEDPNQARIQERLNKMDARATNQEDQALNMAMIRGGLGMAGGQSQNFLSNLTEGFGAGVDTYTGEIDKVRQAENDIFALDTQMANAQRAEQIAGATYGLESLEAEEARNAQIALQTQKDKAIMDRVETQAASAMDIEKLRRQTSPGDMYALYQEYINTAPENPLGFPEFQAMVMGSSGANSEIDSIVDQYATKKKTVNQ